MDLDALYQEIILDHYKNPHHKGLREPSGAAEHGEQEGFTDAADRLRVEYARRAARSARPRRR